MRPLPSLQPDRPQSNPKAPEFSSRSHSRAPELWGIILSFPRLSPTLGHVLHVLLSGLPRAEPSRLAWLRRIPIAVVSGRINQNWRSEASITIHSDCSSERGVHLPAPDCYLGLVALGSNLRRKRSRLSPARPGQSGFFRPHRMNMSVPRLGFPSSTQA